MDIVEKNPKIESFLPPADLALDNIRIYIYIYIYNIIGNFSADYKKASLFMQ